MRNSQDTLQLLAGSFWLYVTIGVCAGDERLKQSGQELVSRSLEAT